MRIIQAIAAIVFLALALMGGRAAGYDAAGHAADIGAAIASTLCFVAACVFAGAALSRES